MRVADMLIRKSCVVSVVPAWGVYLRKQWEHTFAHHLTADEKAKIYLHDKDGACGYLWHLFSYAKAGCIEGGQAERAFSDEPKDTCFVFYQHSDDALIVERASMLAAHDLPSKMDVYVVDREFSWTFVITHETGMCGPYFSRRIGER